MFYYLLGYATVGLALGMWQVHTYWNPKTKGGSLGYKPVLREEGQDAARNRAIGIFATSVVFWPIIVALVPVIMAYTKVDPHVKHRMEWRGLKEEMTQLHKSEANAEIPLSPFPEPWCECQEPLV